MYSTCCVIECPSGPSAPSHRFPKNTELFNKWKAAVFSAKTAHLTDEQFHKCIVCYRHFQDSDYIADYRSRRLIPCSIPILHLKPSNDNLKYNAVGECINNEVPQIPEQCSSTLDQIGQEAQIKLTRSPQFCSNAPGKVRQVYQIKLAQNSKLLRALGKVGQKCQIKLRRNPELGSSGAEKVGQKCKIKLIQSPQLCLDASGKVGQKWEIKLRQSPQTYSQAYLEKVGPKWQIKAAQSLQPCSNVSEKVGQDCQIKLAQSPQPCPNVPGNVGQVCQIQLAQTSQPSSSALEKVTQECQIKLVQSPQSCPNTPGNIGQECQTKLAQTVQPFSSTLGNVGQQCENGALCAVKRPILTVLPSGATQIILTPKRTHLCPTAKALRRQKLALQKKLKATRARLKDAAKYFKETSIQTLLSKLTPTQRTFIAMQLRTVEHKPKGRRYSNDEKILALSLYKQSKSCYGLLTQMFNLPSPKSLNGMLQKEMVRPEIDENLPEVGTEAEHP